MRKTLAGCAAVGVLAAVLIAAAGAALAWRYIRPQPEPRTGVQLFEGVRYDRVVRSVPRPLVIHIVSVDLQADGLRLFVTPGDPEADLPLEARTTGEALAGFDLQIAVNGDAFEPWHANSPLDYYPHTGDRVDVIGLAASDGEIYSSAHKETPTLYIQPNNHARFNRPFANLHHAISGTAMLISNGREVAPDDDAAAPRTAVGLNGAGNTLYLVVVDGRQPGYSEGVSLQELAGILAEFGAYNAMNLDGGGSSTLVREGALGGVVVLNSPVGRTIPGTERPVGNHLGIYARRNGN